MTDGWRARLPELAARIADSWGLTPANPFAAGEHTAWVAPVRSVSGEDLVLKPGWRHWEADHEGDGLQVWDGNGAIRCLRAQTFGDTMALLLERCHPGTQLTPCIPRPSRTP